MKNLMNDKTVNDLHNYIDKIYEPLKYLNDKENVILVRSRIDKGLYVVKYVKTNERQIYDTLKEAAIPGIPEIYEIVSSPDEVLVVEEYIKGITLEEFTDYYLSDFQGTEDKNYAKDFDKGYDKWTLSGALDIDSERDMDSIGLVLKLVNKLCEILDKLHSLQPAIIHRDIKPDNIIIDETGNVFLLDFNISRYYKGGYEKDTVNMGTNGFAAPEQFGFGESSNRTDIYGLGATVKYICEKCDIKSERIDTFVRKCMELSPDDRFADAPAAWRYLECQLTGEENRDMDISFQNSSVNTPGENTSVTSYMERRVNPSYVLPLRIICNNCNEEMEIHSYMNHIKCSTCGSILPFKGLDYKTIDWQSSMYSSVKLWTDCMVCRSPNMYLGAEGKVWKCPDCRFKMTAEEKEESVFWFCDDCETFLNIQENFSTDKGIWICSECGFENDVTEDNII